MSATPIILASGLGKRYVLHHEQSERYLAIRDIISGTVKRLAQKFTYASKDVQKSGQTENFWALKDVSFEIEEGARVGIIGRNGAGKSTLLKLLSRITEPTTGSIRLRGRVGSLLEVGTGFHPELSGRENIFLNGVILGMTRAEIHRKFDDIVAFAEIERFLDTPVKRYSSGMYVRLAFAVAAHLEPEILIVDEVLAVGDAQFQKKCLGKMEEIGKQGRTVLFVSHNMNAIAGLCTSAMLIRQGELEMYSTNISEVIQRYLTADAHGVETCWKNLGAEHSNPYFRPLRLALVSDDGKSIIPPVRNDETIWVEIDGYIEMSDPALTVGYALFSNDGTLLYWSYQTDCVDDRWGGFPKGKIKLRSRLPQRLLNEGSYRIELIGGLHFRQWLFEPGASNPEVCFELRGGLSTSPYWMVRRPGMLAPDLNWEWQHEIS